MQSYEPSDMPLNVTFTLPQWGWIDVWVPPLTDDTEIRASNTDDPFPDLLEWLEAIADGVELAAWRVSEESCLAQIIFVTESNRTFDRAPAQLILTRTDRQGRTYHLVGRPVERLQVLRAFYTAFRAMAEHPDYGLQHWEGMEPEMRPTGRSFVSDGYYTWPRMRALRSLRVEAALAANEVQASLDLPFRR